MIIDIGGRGFRLSASNDGVLFDMNADGQLEHVGWTTATSDNGFLVLDRNANGRIDDSTELFGELTPQPPSATRNGFAALAVFDDPLQGGNGDRVINEKDAIYSRLRIWIDMNHDGVSQSNEVFALRDVGIQSISLAYEPFTRTDGQGNYFRYRTNVEGASGAHIGKWAYDVFLSVSP